MSEFPFKHIIWDWNGTLLDDISLTVEVLNEQFREIGYQEISVETHRVHFEIPVKNYYRKLGINPEGLHFEQLAKEFHRIYETKVRSTVLHVGVQETLQNLSAKGVSHSVLSAHPHHLLFDILSHFGIKEIFESIRGQKVGGGGDKTMEGKKLVEELNYETNEILLVGDTTHDFEVARALGIKCVLVSHGHQSRARLASHGVAVVDTLAEIFSKGSD